MSWIGVITNIGASLLAEWMGAATLNIDGAVAGTGTVPEVSLLAQTALAEQKQEVSIVSSKKVDSGWKVKVQVVAPNTGYTLNQIGVKGRLDGGASVMLALFQNEDGIPIPSNSESPDFVYSFYGILAISNTGELSISVDTSALVSTSTLQEALTEYVPLSRKVNNKALSSDVTLTASDVDAVPANRTVNGKALSSNVTLTGADINVSGSDDTPVSTALSNKVDAVAPMQLNLPMSSGWGGNSMYSKTQDETVLINLYAQLDVGESCTDGTVIATLPTGYRPTGERAFAVSTQDSTGRGSSIIRIPTGGSVIYQGKTLTQSPLRIFGCLMFIAD